MSKGKYKRARNPAMARRDIPLAQRLQIQKYARITAEREDACIRIMKCACCVLHKRFGLAFQRLTRFAITLRKKVHTFYDTDTIEVQEEHLIRSMQALGFDVALATAEDRPTTEPHKKATSEEISWERKDAETVIIFLSFLALNECQGYGHDRLELYAGDIHQMQ